VLEFGFPQTVDCSDAGASSVSLSWRAADAARIEISIDGPGIYQSYEPEDSPVSVPFACDGRRHVYQIVAVGADGRRSAARQATIRPKPVAPPTSAAPSTPVTSSPPSSGLPTP
jgi:2-polyprenyl-6-methoxyphenol hydroxylase-like FAD-dependent oxidoreductase